MRNSPGRKGENLNSPSTPRLNTCVLSAIAAATSGTCLCFLCISCFLALSSITYRMNLVFSFLFFFFCRQKLKMFNEMAFKTKICGNIHLFNDVSIFFETTIEIIIKLLQLKMSLST